jgi:hypothetical protein
MTPPSGIRPGTAVATFFFFFLAAMRMAAAPMAFLSRLQPTLKMMPSGTCTQQRDNDGRHSISRCAMKRTKVDINTERQLTPYRRVGLLTFVIDVRAFVF